MDPVTTMCPPEPRSSAGSRACVTRSTPSTLMSYMACQSAGSAVETGSAPSAPPALLTSTATSSSESASDATEAGEVTSSGTARMPGVDAAKASSRSSRRAAATTEYPSAARRRAVAAPIPLLAPVTTAVPRSGMVTILPTSPPAGMSGGSCAVAVTAADAEGAHSVQRVAMLSVHTSPLEAPGGGDAGGMNVYIVETAKRMADAGTEVEIFTRATSSELPPCVEMHPGVLVRHVTAGPFEGLAKNDLPAQMCAFTAAVLRAEAHHEPGWYDLIHSHYWLSGQVGWLARDRWGVPLVHTAHTLGKVKNAALAVGDVAEPLSRIIGEEQVVAEADRLVASTRSEAHELVAHYQADPTRVDVVPPGVDLRTFTPEPADRAPLGIPQDAHVLLFAGRI